MIYLSYLEFKTKAKNCSLCGKITPKANGPDLCIDSSWCSNFQPMGFKQISREVFAANPKAAIDLAMVIGELLVVDEAGNTVIRFSTQQTEI